MVTDISSEKLESSWTDWLSVCGWPSISGFRNDCDMAAFLEHIHETISESKS